MAFILTTAVDADTEKIIESGIPQKWRSKYEFLRRAVDEKLRREGLK